MIHLSDSLSFYKRPDIQNAIVDHAPSKEIAARFNDTFGKRPDVLQYPSDIMEFAKKGATSFHCSEELWSNPLQLQPGMIKKDLDALRIGWDLILDVDYKNFQYSKIAANLIVQALQHHNVKSISVKFSGNKGFHIAVPFEAFPTEYDGTDMKLLFPDATKRIVLYINEKIKTILTQKLIELEGGSLSKVADNLGIDKNFLSKVNENMRVDLTYESFLEIDVGLISSRHMYRMPYSLHEKSGLVSLPIPLDSIMSFERESASPEKVKVSDIVFLDRSQANPSEAAALFVAAFDHTAKRPEIELEEKKEYEVPEDAIPEEMFPPCMKKLLNGIEDGRKRALFILINFLTSCGWDHDTMDARLKEWNKKNKEPLREQYLLGQIRYAKQHKKKVLPPNCHNPAYYIDLRVKCPEEICSKVKNPVVYSRRKATNN